MLLNIANNQEVYIKAVKPIKYLISLMGLWRRLMLQYCHHLLKSLKTAYISGHLYLMMKFMRAFYTFMKIRSIMDNFLRIRKVEKVQKLFWTNKLFLKVISDKGKKLVNFGLKGKIKLMQDFFKKDFIMDKENYKQKNQFIKDNFKMEKNMDLVNNSFLKLE